MSLVTAAHITNWSNTSRRACQGFLPELVRRLIRATAKGVSEITFPVGDAVSDEGWDGVLVCQSNHPKVPDGVSGWEIGTDKSAPGKAKCDYEKREKDPLGLKPSNTTFVFVTPKAWPTRRSWAEEKRKAKFWKDVRVIGASDLQDWLDDAPVVDQWLARQIGITPSTGLRELEYWWQEYAWAINPRLTPEILLAGRAEEANTVCAWAEQGAAALYVQADAPDEALAFLYASLAAQDPNADFSNVMVADTEEAFRTAAGWSIPHIIACTSDVAAHLAGIAEQKGHKPYIATSRNIGARRERPMRLSRPVVEDFEKGLVASNYSEADARRVAWECGRSIPVLRRMKIARNPPWAEPGEGELLVPALICGAWSEHERANPFVEKLAAIPLRDRQVVALFADGDFLSASAAVKRWAERDDPPLRRVDTDWKLTAPVDAWFLLARYVERKHFDQLQQTVLDVLTAVDPKFELPESQWFSAGMYGKLPPYSSWLQEGLAQTLAIVANYGGQLDLRIGDGSAFVDNVLRRLFAELKTWQAWASIDSLLPLLAEAAPVAFLSGVDRFLSRHETEVIKLLAGGKDAMSSGCLHAGLLWALERVAWSPRHLKQCCTLLARLHAIDPGSHWGNRPFGSLEDILGWPDAPYTYANASERSDVLDALVTGHRDTAWQLLTSALKAFHSRTVRHPPLIGQSKPASWKPDSQSEVEAYCRRIIDHVFALAASGAAAWTADLIEIAPHLPPVEQNRLAQLLTDVSHRIQGDERQGVLSKLDGFLERIEAGFLPRPPTAELQRVAEETYELLLDRSAVAQARLWFSDDPPRIPGFTIHNWQARNAAVAERQREVVKALLAELGLVEALKQADSLVRKWDFGFALAACTSPVQDAELCSPFTAWPRSSMEQLSSVLLGYANQKYSSIGEVWLAEWLGRLSSEADNKGSCATLLLVLPQTQSTWDRVTQLGPAIEELYWSCCHGHPEQNEPIQSVSYALEKLCSVERAGTALQVISQRTRLSIPGVSLMRAAMAYLSEIVQKSVFHVGSMEIYYVEQLFEAIDRCDEIPGEDRASLEWAYFPILRHSERKPIELYARLASSPELFVNLVSAVWRSPGREADPVSEAEKVHAEKAYWLLNGWDSPLPGQLQNGFDPAVLRAWIDEARRLLHLADLEKIGDDQIGKMLSAAPVDPDDKLWPHNAVRDALEVVASDELETAFQVGKNNRRGVTTRGLRDGGVQERLLASEYQAASDRMHNQWPKTAYILRQMSLGYLNDAKWHDDDVARRDL